jgi:hypothetical protein
MLRRLTLPVSLLTALAAPMAALAAFSPEAPAPLAVAPTSIAAADLDGDSHPDVFVVGHGPASVWFGDGGGGLVPGDEDIGDDDAYDVALGDLDQDGDVDAVVACGDGTVAVWLNDGFGSFTAGDRFEDGAPRAVAIGDMNGDELPDVLAGNEADGTRLWVGDGDGGFTQLGISYGLARTTALALVDLDTDGDLDVLEGNGGADRSYRNDHFGTLTARPGVWGVGDTTALVTGRFDGDDWVDFYAASAVDGPQLWLGDGFASFRAGTAPGAAGARDATGADVNGDGRVDLILANDGPDTIFLGDGAGGFAPSGDVFPDEPTSAVTTADLDGDGDADLLLAGPTALQVWRNLSAPTAGADRWRHVGSGPLAVAAPGVLTNDRGGDGLGLSVSLLAGPAQGSVELAADGSFVYTPPPNGHDGDVTFTYTLSDGTASSTGVVTLALQAFGVVAVSPRPFSHDAPWEGPITLTFSDPVDPATVRWIAVSSSYRGRLGASRILDGDTVTIELDEPLMLGEDVKVAVPTRVLGDRGQAPRRPYGFTFRAAIPHAAAAWAWQFEGGGGGTRAAVADIDHDGDLDSVAAGDWGPPIQVYYNDGHANFVDSGQAICCRDGFKAALIDINDDSYVDLVVPNNDRLLVRLNDRSGIFYDAGRDLTIGDTYRMVVGDLNVDGADDLVLWGGYGHRVFLSDNAGRFVQGQTLSDVPEARDRALADVDADGVLDFIAFGFIEPYISSTVDRRTFIYYGNGDGTFRTPATKIAHGDVYSGTFFDRDADGDLDAVLDSEHAERNTVHANSWRNDDGVLVPEARRMFMGRAGVAIDLNADGLPDLASPRWEYFTNGLGGDTFSGGVSFNDGTGRFGEPTLEPLDSSYDGIGAWGDLDGDGDLDFFDDDIGGGAKFLGQRPPIPGDDVYEVVAGQTLNVPAPGFLANDVDPDDTTLTAFPAGLPQAGFVIGADGSLRVTTSAVWPEPPYTLEADYWVAGPFRDYNQSRGHITVHVLSADQPPTAGQDGPLTTPEDAPLTLAAPGLLVNDQDPEGQPLEAWLVTGATHGEVTVQRNGALQYLPDPDFYGADAFVYEARDPGGRRSAPITVTVVVTPTNDPPTAGRDTAAVREDGLLVLDAPGLLQNDDDIDGDALSTTLGVPPAHGAVLLSPDGGLTYQPDPDWYGVDSFTYAVSDGSDSADGEVLVEVIEVNDAPVFIAPTPASVAGFVGQSVDLRLAAYDVDLDPLRFLLISAPPGVVLDEASGEVSWTPTAPHASDWVFDVDDGRGGVARAVIPVLIVADNCPDAENPDQADLDGDGRGDACDTCQDPDGDGAGLDNPLRTCPRDLCPDLPEAIQSDADADGLGDGCDPCTDRDGDGRGDPGFVRNTCAADTCPLVHDDGADADQDGLGDACDPCTDRDSDGLGDPGFPANTCARDLCPTAPGGQNIDSDGDGLGDRCDPCTDVDGDGLGDPGFANVCGADLCPLIADSGADGDLDGQGDACDPCTDGDGDGLGDPGFRNSCPTDLCPEVAGPNADADADGQGDACDLCTDRDGDGLGDPGFPANTCAPDTCPDLAGPTADADADGLGDACDLCTDRDGDGLGDPGFAANTCAADTCPDLAGPTADADADGLGDACDLCTDRDGDGLGDPGFAANTCAADTCPDLAGATADADADGLGDACDLCTDGDGDGFGDPGFPANTCGEDNCPTLANPDQAPGCGDTDVGETDLEDTDLEETDVGETDPGETESDDPEETESDDPEETDSPVEDSDLPVDSDTDVPDKDPGEPQDERGSCGCTTGTSPSAVAAIAAAYALRRRRGRPQMPAQCS